MVLLPPPSDLTASNFTLLISLIQAHAKEEGYAVVVKRSNKDKRQEKDKIWLHCTRGGKIRTTTGKKRKHGTSRRNNCPFELILKLDKWDDIWRLRIKEASHNHDSGKRVAHAVHRLAALTPQVEAQIIQWSADRTCTTATMLYNLNRNHEEDPIWTKRDIQNAKYKIRQRMLEGLTPTQALLKWLHASDEWYVVFLKDSRDRVTHLFFSRKSCHKMLKENWEVVIMDATYKTNRYKLPLLIITGVNALGGSFYVAFCFLAGEQFEDYFWALQQYRNMCIELDVRDPLLNITDREESLINAHNEVFPDSEHMLCVWHINRNVVANCKPCFYVKEDWVEFYAHWFRVMYAVTVTIFEAEWKSLQEVYNRYDPAICVYLTKEWIGPFTTKFIRCYTNKILHFFNTATSKGEGGNAVLKRELKFSTGDLEKVVKDIAKLLSLQRSTYIGDIESAKVNVPMDLRRREFRDIIARVTPFALRRVLDQYKAEREPKDCTNSFTTVSGLPCIHRVKARIAEGAGTIHIDDVHPHWRFQKPAASYTRGPLTEVEDLRQPIDSLLSVHEPAVARTKGRPTGPRELPTRAELEFQRSTQREPSRFERAEAYLVQRNETEPTSTSRGGSSQARGRGRVQPRGRERGRGRGRGRGQGRGRGRGTDDTATLAEASEAPEEAEEASEASEASDSSDSDVDRASDSDSERVPLKTARPTIAPDNDSDNDSINSIDSISSDMMAKWALSEDPQLEERQWRLNSGLDYGGFLQKSLDNHIHNIARNPEGVKEDAIKWRRIWAQKIPKKLTRQQFYYAINEDDIPDPPHFDKSLDGPFKSKQDQFRSMAERLHSWAICDSNKEAEINPLRHSPERVLGYWNKYDPQHKMPTNPLPPPATVQTRPLAERPRRRGSTQSRAGRERGRGRGGSAPAWQQGAEALFGSFRST